MHNMRKWHKSICSISKNRWLTKSLLRRSFLGFIFLMFIYAAFLFYNVNHLTVKAAFKSKGNVTEIIKDLLSGEGKINLFGKIWNLVAPERESVHQNVPVMKIIPSAQSDERTRHPVANHFRYIINEEHKCRSGSPFLMLMIPVTPSEVEARQAIRNTWGNESLVPGVHIIRIFLLGVASEPGSELQPKIMEESTKYHDIIQQEYLDTYHNLTIKVLMGMNWVVTYCPDTAYVMKVDSDMFLNPEYLIYNVLKPDMPPRHGYFTGCIMKGHLPIRDRNSKWYMPPEEYPGDRYPPFCSGTGYVFSGDLAEKIFNVSLTIKCLPLEDVYMGVCLSALGLEPLPPPKSSDFNYWTVAFSTCQYSQIVTAHMIPPGKLINYWEQMQQNKQHPC